MSQTTAEYQVTGMTCEHCARAVAREVGALAGVADVAVDLATGRVTVRGSRPLGTAEMAAAVDEAGYQLCH